MGITGLLPLLKSITVSTHVKHYGQQTLGVDAYVWLHRGAIACAWELALGKPTTKYVDYAMHRVRMLQHYGVTPYIVFDGDYLPSKAGTERERAARRMESAKAGREHMSRGNTKMAQESFQKAIDITPDMALRFIKALQKEKIDYVVAPYEADAQLAYLERIGLIDGIVTEDSDLLVFGCKKVLFKMNEFGECMEIDRARFGNNSGMSLAGWDDNMFRYMAILSGCDYLVSIPGMGLKTAHGIVRRYKKLDCILKALRRQYGLRMPAEYEEKFRRADITFLSQRVFCPVKRVVIMGQAPPFHLDEETLKTIGAEIPDDLAKAIAAGAVDPITKKIIVLEELPAESKSKTRPSLKHASTAPEGNSLIDAFLVPKQSQPVASVLGSLDPNGQCASPSIDSVAMAKRLAPRPSLREQAQIKKLKLFESSPSPPARSVGRLNQVALAESNSNKENFISPFFAPKSSHKESPRKITREDRDLEQALRASVQEEERRKQFQGFQNPVAFEVATGTSTTSHHFSTPGTKASQVSTVTDDSFVNNLGLATPPDSQDTERLVSGWKKRYSMTQSPSLFSSVLSQKRPSTSISRMAGKVLSRQSSMPDISSFAQRRPFTCPSSLSQPQPSEPSD